ncbi:hypothetical protein C8R43DRAFT_946401 [Mycena crocata]|nr:hypothetical protein C8R43DRAFT_946401 [Mycena crocata]
MTNSQKFGAERARNRIKTRKESLRRLKHKIAQRRYRERNLEVLRDEARNRMQEHRTKIKQSKELTEQHRELRRETDADYRERMSACDDVGDKAEAERLIVHSKFRQKFGQERFEKDYFPLLRFHGNETGKLKFLWKDQAETTAQLERLVLEDSAS